MNHKSQNPRIHKTTYRHTQEELDWIKENGGAKAVYRALATEIKGIFDRLSKEWFEADKAKVSA